MIFEGICIYGFSAQLILSKLDFFILKFQGFQFLTAVEVYPFKRYTGKKKPLKFIEDCKNIRKVFKHTQQSKLYSDLLSFTCPS